MLSYEQLKQDRRKFRALTGLTPREFMSLLPVFEYTYRRVYPSDKTLTGQPRQRIVGGGRKSALSGYEQKLLFILVHQKVHPRQELLGELFGLSQSRANDWIHRLLPILKLALDGLSLSSNGVSCQFACKERCKSEPKVISDKFYYRHELGENQS